MVDESVAFSKLTVTPWRSDPLSSFTGPLISCACKNDEDVVNRRSNRSRINGVLSFGCKSRHSDVRISYY
jgi:hypothetical protein